jgi:hypothetical protein
MAKYEVLVGNIGSVINTDSLKEAQDAYDTYVEQSKQDRGRACGEDVCLMEDGEPIKEHSGSLHDEEEMGKGGKAGGFEVYIDKGKEEGTETLETCDTKAEAEKFKTDYQAKHPDAKLGIDNQTEAYVSGKKKESFGKGGKTGVKKKKPSPKKYTDKFEEFYNWGSNIGYARDFGHVGLSDVKGKDEMEVPLILVAKIINMYEATGDKKFEGKPFQVTFEISPRPDFIDKKHYESVLESSGLEDDYTADDYDALFTDYIEGYAGGVPLMLEQDKFELFKDEDEAEKYIMSKEINSKLDGYKVMIGFYMDGQINRAGNSRWGYLTNMVDASQDWMKMYRKGGKAGGDKTWIVTGGGLAKPLEIIGGTKGDAIENAIDVLRPVFGTQPKNKFTAVEKKEKGGATAGSPFWNKFWNSFEGDGALITGGSYFKAEKKGSGGAILGILAGGGLGFIFGSASKQKGYPKRISADGSKYYQWNDHKGWVEFTGEEYHALTQGNLYKYNDKEGYYALKIFEKGGKAEDRVITFDDGFQFRVVTFDYAKKNWDKEQIYKIFEDEQSESLVDDGRRLSPDSTYAVEIGFKKEKGGDTNKSAVARERKYTSKEEHEKAYKGSRKSRVRYYQKHEKGGEAGMSLSEKENDTAIEEGWVISNNEADETEIQKWDEAGIFKSDSEAKAFVSEKAKGGSALHKKALEVVEECNKMGAGGSVHAQKYSQKHVRMTKRGRGIDAKVPAKKAGWRKSEETGDWYYENRKNRSDANPRKKI